MAHLKVLSSDSQDFTGRELSLDGDEITIGRQADSTILVPDAAVSRRHAKIVRTPEGLLLVDDGGRNGLFVNGERVTHRLLSSGDVVRVGHTDMEFIAGPAQPAEAAPPPRKGTTRPPLEERLEQTTMLEPAAEALAPRPPTRQPSPPTPLRRPAPRPEPARPARTEPDNDTGDRCPACLSAVAEGAVRCTQCGALVVLTDEEAPRRGKGALSAPRALAALGLLAAGILLVLLVLAARDQGLIGRQPATDRARPTQGGTRTSVR
jgi:hypothetical protein